MQQLPWRDAIIEVLKQRGEPMHYTEIAEAIAEAKLRTDFGATPASSVNATISVSIQDEGAASPYIRAGRGIYGLRSATSTPSKPSTEPEETEADETGLINAFGMYWSRTHVLWTALPKILGQQQPGSTPVDFCQERGVYLLYDGRAVVYVGRTTNQPLGLRLFQHTIDRLNGRWDRFSWFGVYPVTEAGALDVGSVHNLNVEMLIVTMEALLIEGLEPPQNRKRGDDFRAVEFLQVEDPSIHKNRILQLMDELKKKL